jgi:phosphate-selective porin
VGEFNFFVPLFYKVEFSLVGEKFVLEEVYVGFKKVPIVQNVILGNQQTPMALEGAVSGRDLTFMEQAAPVQAFAPGIKPGVFVGGPVDDRLTWGVGWFSGSSDVEVGGLSGLTTGIGRVTGLAWDRMDGASRHLLHLGLSASLIVGGGEAVRFRARPEVHLAPFLVDTKNIEADTAFTLGAEIALVRGPLSFKAEYLRSTVNQSAGPSQSFSGFYG